MQDLEHNLHIQGESMVKQLAQAGRYPIVTSNIEELFELTKLSLIDNHVDSVAIFDKDKNVLAANGLDKNYLMSAQDLNKLTKNTRHVLHHDDNVDFLAPIIIDAKYLTKYNLKLLSLDKEENSRRYRYWLGFCKPIIHWLIFSEISNSECFIPYFAF